MVVRILFAGGGTGGHVYPALATIEALKVRGEFEFLYVGGRNGIEARIIPGYGLPFRTIWIAGFQRYFTWRNFIFPVKLVVSLLQSWKILRDFKPHIAVGTGGYVSGPVLYMATKLGIPILIQEQDVFPGLTTRLLAKYVQRICLPYEAAREFFSEYLEKTVVTGNPVRRSLKRFSRQKVLNKWKLDPRLPVLLVFGGSQGARAINQAMLKILPETLQKYPLQVIWQTGEREFEAVRTAIDFNLNRLRLLPYIEEMGEAYAAADFILSRAGAITLAELANVAKPTILVPYPHAAGKHQEHNARLIAREGAAILLLEGEGWEIHLREAIESILENERRRTQMIQAWKKLSRPEAAEKIAIEILKLLETKVPNEN